MDYSSLYDHNMSLFSELRPELDLGGLPGKLPESVQVATAKNGSLTATLEGNLLHSRYNPEKEAEKFVSASGIEPGDSVICYGFGLGYHVEAILQGISPDSTCYVIELNKTLLASAMILRDLSSLIEDDRLTVVCGHDQTEVAEKCTSLISGISEERLSRTRIVIHPPSFKLMPDGFESIRGIFDVMLMERSMPQVFKKQSTENVARNLDHVLAWPGINEVLQPMKGQPAFLISAGPSLDDAIPRLQRLQERAWIVCVDTAFSALLDASIRPDLVITVDPQAESLGHFKNNLGAGIPLVFIPNAAANVIEEYGGPKIVAVQAEHSIVSKFEHLISHKGTVHAGGSTACIALAILVRSGASPIFLVGQDCGFPDMKVYSSNVPWTRRMLGGVNRFMTLEMKHRNIASSGKLMRVKNRFGQDMLTHQNLFSYLREIERIIGSSQNTVFYNFFSRGAAISGARDIYFDEEVEPILASALDKKLSVRRGDVDEKLKAEILDILSEKGTEGNQTSR